MTFSYNVTAIFEATEFPVSLLNPYYSYNMCTNHAIKNKIGYARVILTLRSFRETTVAVKKQ
jgi:hypothetical protein